MHPSSNTPGILLKCLPHPRRRSKSYDFLVDGAGLILWLQSCRPNPVVATLSVSPKRVASLPETPLSSLLLSSGDTTRVPCGTCYVVDYTDGRNVTFPGGLDVIGRLRFPPGADVTIRATSVVVQGILRVDPPDAGARSGFVLYENEGEHEVHRAGREREVLRRRRVRRRAHALRGGGR